MSPSAASQQGSDVLLAEIVEEFTNRVQAGEAVDVESYIHKHPDHAERLRSLLPALALLDDLGRSLSPAAGGAAGQSPEDALSGVLGDFRILREVGKGGMGVVYEAEQISLRRRVALKVLPFAATMDARHLQRFHNEAQAAACLHHTNIVPVFSVGCERGVHFYAMQFIDGQPLSELIHQMRQREKKAPTVPKGEPTVVYQSPAAAASSTPLPVADLTPLTGEGRRGQDYFRKLAELGVQAAEALDHAHQLGIVHRDIKPANLLLDGTGRVWITDFGLAHMQHGEANLTLTGQAVGTPRYMSPEQALAKRVPIDHRTDVYSLGVTLYELLTLRPAFASEDRQELLRQIAFEDPSRPRRIERAIPAELEIIVLKAMEKRPQDRYGTAQELTDDLRRWLLDQPIRARRPTWTQTGRKWLRRHQAVVWSAAVCTLLMVGVIGACLGWIFGDQAARRTKAAESFDQALQQGIASMLGEKWLEAKATAQRAADLLAGVGDDPLRQQRLQQLERDLKMAETLEWIRIQQTEVKVGHFDLETAASPVYAAAFQAYNLPVLELGREETAQRINDSSIREQLLAALEAWTRTHPDPGKRKKLGELLRWVSPNPWSMALEEALVHQDGRKLALLAESAVAQDKPGSLDRLGRILAGFDKPAAIQFLRQAQQRHPDDFWFNHQLAHYLAELESPQLEEAIGFYRAALALRPHSPAVHVNLGLALSKKGRFDEAIAETGVAIRLKNQFALAHNNPGNALLDKGELAEAIAEYREAIRLNTDTFEIHNNLGNALREKGQTHEAIAEYREAIRLKTDGAEAHNGLGLALEEQFQHDEAIAEYCEAIRLKKDFPEAHSNLGRALCGKGRLDEAIAECREAIRLKMDYPEAHNNLGSALRGKGQLDEAIAEYREAIRLKKDYRNAHLQLGIALMKKRQFQEALEELRFGDKLESRDLRFGNRFGSRNPLSRLPFAHWVREAEQMVALDTKLSAVLEGKEKPADVAERLVFAQLCQLHRRRHAAAVRFYSEAFDLQKTLTDDRRRLLRYNAACSAALAGCGEGKDAPSGDTDRTRLRGRALEWLGADLKTEGDLLHSSKLGQADAARKRLEPWLVDPDFNGVRGPDALAKLPDAEREAWRQLWADVAQMLAKTQGKAAAERKPDTK